jgi:integrase
MISHNPTDYAEVPRQKRSEMRALTPEEAAAFLEAVRSDRLAALFDLALTSGMRPEEYLGLKWTDIDWQAGTVTVQRALIWPRSGKHGNWRFDEPKTSSSRRTIPLPPSTLRALKEHHRRQAEERLRVGAKWNDHGLIFTNLHGGPLVRFYVIAKHFKPALKRAGLPESIRLYDLRHSCATLLLVAGENPKVVSERLGHASVAITLDIYSHVLPHMQQAASEKLENLLYGRGGTQ